MFYMFEDLKYLTHISCLFKLYSKINIALHIKHFRFFIKSSKKPIFKDLHVVAYLMYINILF